MPRAASDFSPIYPNEHVVLSFDFSSALAPSETILTSTPPTVSALLVSGTDATPSVRCLGTPSKTGSIIMQMVGNCQSGAIYDIIATAYTTTGQVLIVNAHLPCHGVE